MRRSQHVELRTMNEKLLLHGEVTSVQPRIRLLRSFSERSHAYLGYCLRIQGTIDEELRAFSVGIGRVAQAKHGFQVGDEITGESLPVPDDRLEPVEFYKVSKLKVIRRGAAVQTASPPWHGAPVALEFYRKRGHRRLDAKTYSRKCATCIWGCRMPVEMTIDHWNPQKKRYRFETKKIAMRLQPRRKTKPKPMKGFKITNLSATNLRKR